MSSEVAICNMALGGVGVGREISSLTEASQEATKCNLFYATCRDLILRDFDWAFARRYETLGLVAEDPNTDWIYSYRYPSGCLNVRGIVGATRADITRIPWQLGSDASGKLIYTDQAEAVARITVRITDSEVFDPLFVEALAGLLGWRIGPGLSRDAKLVDQSRERYISSLASARADAGNEGRQDEPPEAESIRVRS